MGNCPSLGLDQCTAAHRKTVTANTSDITAATTDNDKSATNDNNTNTGTDKNTSAGTDNTSDNTSATTGSDNNTSTSTDNNTCPSSDNDTLSHNAATPATTIITATIGTTTAMTGTTLAESTISSTGTLSTTHDHRFDKINASVKKISAILTDESNSTLMLKLKSASSSYLSSSSSSSSSSLPLSSSSSSLSCFVSSSLSSLSGGRLLSSVSSVIPFASLAVEFVKFAYTAYTGDAENQAALGRLNERMQSLFKAVQPIQDKITSSSASNNSNNELIDALSAFLFAISTCVEVVFRSTVTDKTALSRIVHVFTVVLSDSGSVKSDVASADDGLTKAATDLAIHVLGAHSEQMKIFCADLNEMKERIERIETKLTDVERQLLVRDWQICRQGDKTEEYNSIVKKGNSEFLQGTRTRFVKKFNEWITDTQSDNDTVTEDNKQETRYLIVTGDAGSGKTILSSVFYERHHINGSSSLASSSSSFSLLSSTSAVVAGHFFRHSDLDLNNPLSAVHSIASQLCNIFPAMKEKLVDQGRWKEDSLDKAFTRLLLEPLEDVVEKMNDDEKKKMCMSGKRAVIILDALDECVASKRASLLTLINRLDELPPFFSFFITSRPEDDLKALFYRKKMLALVLSYDEQDNKQDIKMYLDQRLSSLVKEKQSN